MIEEIALTSFALYDLDNTNMAHKQ